MNMSARSYFMGGIAVACASVIAIASAVAPPPDVTLPANRPVATRVLSEATVELLAAAQRMAPGVVSPAAPEAAAPAPQNAASDLIITAWNAVLPWIDYGVNLTDYVLGFIPYGYLIGDQVSIAYYSLVRPVANSFVVDLVAPVVNAPLNINSYLNGLAALGSVTVTSLINLGINEFNYFFGWLIPPIPPIGPRSTKEAVTEDVTAHSATSSGLVPVKEKHGAVEAEVLGEQVAGEATAKTQEESDVEAVKKPKAAKEGEATTSSSTGVAAQGDVRGTPNEKKTEAAEVNSGKKVKKGDDDQAAGPASGAPTSAATNDDGGAKGGKKDKKK
ncbi:hypothetical protein [Mycolicibacterium moriokaense]|uniref:PE family protein n=1 Tax=Mycolicibacterium moriokaense TaxID=39691 RepID=A0A318HPR5_9MYCO|nr:hypothetical protein [Mycolicibacterium moriokaense]PXX08924.1 hypothetical protein C8E89_107229 [Mycolicibacterium moriokaense]